MPNIVRLYAGCAGVMIETMGIIAVAIMVSAYALEDRGNIFVLIFALGCVLAAIYALIIGSIPFVIAEGIWAAIAFRRWYKRRS